MRIYFTSTLRPKLVARALRKSLGARGRPTKVMESQEIAARMFGYPSWTELIKLHATRPPSLDDAEAPSQRGLRRQQFWEVLTGLGLASEQIGEILAEVRPTDRTTLPPDGLPRLLVEAFETDKEGSRLRSLGIQDLTWAAVNLMVPNSYQKTARDFPDRPTVYSLSSSLSDPARHCGMDGRLALPDLRSHVDAFVTAIGGPAALPLYRKRLDEKSMAQSSLEEARRELAAVEFATFSTDYAAYQMFYSGHFSREYGESIEDMTDDWGWDDYVAIHPRPPYSNEEASKAWNAAYEAWIADHAPPFVFATQPEPWGGIRPETLREHVADEPEREPDVADIAYSSLDEHYEDASDDIVDLDGVCNIVHEWFPHAGKNDDMDLGLEAKIEAWNAKQRIVSFYPENRIILPSFPGKTKEDAIAWCRGYVEQRRQRLNELGTWVAPTSEPASPGP